MMVDRARIESLLPHTDSMCLIDSVEAFDALLIVCQSRQHRSAANPLRRHGRLSSVHAIEFAAQAAALHGALSAPDATLVRTGMLVSVGNCELHVTDLDTLTGSLRIEARRSAATASLTGYEFTVSSPGGPIASGRLGVYGETR